MPHLFNIILDVLATENQIIKRNKNLQIGKEEAKLSLIADDMILYTEKPKDPHKLLELIYEFSKAVEHKN